MIVWYEDENQSNRWAVWGRRMDGTTLVGSSFAISNPAGSWNYDPDVAYNLNMNEFLVVYTRDSSKGVNAGTRDVFGTRLYNNANSTIGLQPEGVIDSSGQSQDEPSVSAYRLNQTTPYLVVFRDHWNDAAGDVRGYLLNKKGVPMTLINIATRPNILEGKPKIHSNEPRGGYAVLWRESVSGSQDNVRWRTVESDGRAGPSAYVVNMPGSNRNGDIVNSFPFPLSVWNHNNGYDDDVYGRFLYDAVYLPAVMRHP